MREKVTLLFLFALCLFALGLSGKEFVLVKGGKARAVIVRNAKVASVIKHFQQEAGKCGVKFPLANANADTKSSKILFVVKDMPVVKNDVFTIDYPDKKTMRITSSELSARYAVTYILEKAFKVNYVFPHLPKFYGKKDINDFPKAVDIAMPRVKYSSRPYSFPLKRTVDYHQRNWMQNWGSKAPFLGGHFMPIDVFPVYKYGPGNSWPQEILPTHRGKKYVMPKVKKLPLPKNPYLAKKGFDCFWNPCFTNPKTTTIAIENIMEILAKNPKKREIDMGLNDNGGMCECASCKKAVGGKRNSGGYADWTIPYWTWVNNVANAVTKKYPHVYFICLAYREVMDPPPFKLNKNIVPLPCFEIYGMREKPVYKNRMDVMKKWSKVVSNIDHYDYSYGLGSYLFPRLLWTHQAEIMGKFNKLGVNGMGVEASLSTPFEGPKFYQLFRLMQNVESDPEALAKEWCIKAVGAKAAPALMKYYKFWEKYWMGEEIRKTGWYKTITNIYQQLGELPTHTFALRKGDMAYLRKLMEEVVAKAGTAQEKRRAKILMDLFEFSESAATALLSEYIPADGNLRSAKEALALLQNLPKAVAALERFEKNPYWAMGKKRKLQGSLIANIGMITPFLKDPAIRKELQLLSKNDRLPMILRGMIKIWLGAKVKNLIANGSMENASPLPTGWNGIRQGARRNTEFASKGKYSLKARQSLMLEYVVNVEKNKTYLLIFSAFIPKGSAEGRLHYMITPRHGKRARNHIRNLDISLPGGAWQTFTGAVTIAPERQDNMAIHIWARKYEKDESIWIDDVQLYCLDDIK